jgi:hypothetical protein
MVDVAQSPYSTILKSGGYATHASHAHAPLIYMAFSRGLGVKNNTLFDLLNLVQ